MENIVFLIMRRMRQPLLTLVVAYTVAIFGMVLIPGRDAAGNVWHMDIFHAFYFVSFMSTTIGFGEIPHEFTDAQRLWVTFALYMTVIAWLYAIGTIFALLQDKTFQMAITERRFAARIRALRESFYLVCGYGETGAQLVKALTDRAQHAVVIDIREERTSIIQLQNLREQVPSLTADARRPRHLLEAGLEHPACAGVVALTDSNAANLKIAITAKLLHPDIRVICRADSHDVEANMASFGTDYIIDPFDTFATHLATALQAPCLYLLMQWLTGVENDPLSEPVYPPSKGAWIICGYGRFGKAVYQRLQQEGIKTVVIEATPERTGKPPEGCVVGRGTEASTLLEANVESAVGLVAGTDDDANNLSIIMTARDLNPKLFVVARQNHFDNRRIIDAVEADMVMHPSNIIADKIRVLLGTPLLFDFVHLAMYQDDAWACQLVSRISALVQHQVPNICECTIDSSHAPAVVSELGRGGVVTLGEMIRDPWDRHLELGAIFLLLERGRSRKLLPDGDTRLEEGDRLLVCGSNAAFTRLNWSMKNERTLAYVRTGEDRCGGWVWRQIDRARRGKTREV